MFLVHPMRTPVNFFCDLFSNSSQVILLQSLWAWGQMKKCPVKSTYHSNARELWNTFIEFVFITQNQSTLFIFRMKMAAEAYSYMRNSYCLLHQQNHKTDGIFWPSNYILKALSLSSTSMHLPTSVTLGITGEFATVYVLSLLLFCGVALLLCAPSIPTTRRGWERFYKGLWSYCGVGSYNLEGKTSPCSNTRKILVGTTSKVIYRKVAGELNSLNIIVSKPWSCLFKISYV